MTTIKMPRAQAESIIDQRIEIGKSLRDRTLRTKDDLDCAAKDGERWHFYNIDLLKNLFTESVPADKYSVGEITAFTPSRAFLEQIDEFRRGMDAYVNRLLYIRESLGMADTVHPHSPEGESMDNQSVFLVHGRDDSSRETVARFMEKLGLRVIVLHEQPSKGRTIIEKFEQDSRVGFAVALLTPDDVGAPKDNSASPSPRARQNVIFELGYFYGMLGRSRVCALYGEGVEIPSDFYGVVYIPLDSAGGWRLKLAKELLEADMKVNINSVL